MQIDPTLIEPLPVIEPLPALDSASALAPSMTPPLQAQFGTPLSIRKHRGSARCRRLYPSVTGMSMPAQQYPASRRRITARRDSAWAVSRHLATPTPIGHLPPPPTDGRDSVLDLPPGVQGYGAPAGYAPPSFDANGNYIPVTPAHQMNMMGFAAPPSTRGYADAAIADPTSQVAIRRKKRTLVIRGSGRGDRDRRRGSFSASRACMATRRDADTGTPGADHRMSPTTALTTAVPATAPTPMDPTPVRRARRRRRARPPQPRRRARLPADAGRGVLPAPSATGATDGGVAATTAAAAATCSVDLKSTPSGAEVARDENTVIGTTPVKLMLPCEPIKLYFRKARYVGVIKQLTPTATGVAFTAHLFKPTFRVKVSSQPAGATVTVGGKAMGTTPTMIKLNAYEPASITLTKDGYASDTEKVTPKQNNTPVHAILKKTKRGK